MPAVAEAQHLEIVQPDRAAGRRDGTRRALQDTVVRPGERALLDGDVAQDVKIVDVDVGVGEGAREMVGVVAFEAATSLRPSLLEAERLGTTWAACTSSSVPAQYGVLMLTGAEGAVGV